MSPTSSLRSFRHSSSRTYTWRTHTTPPTTTISNVLAVPVNSTSTVSALSTLPSSPLRHEITPPESIERSDVDISRKKREREADDATHSEPHSNHASPKSESEPTKKARLEQTEEIPIAGPSNIRRHQQLNVDDVAETPNPSSASPRTSWFGSVGKAAMRSTSSLHEASKEPTVSHEASTIPPPVPTIPTTDNAVAAIAVPQSLPNGSSNVPDASLSMRSGIASWFTGPPRPRSRSREPEDRVSIAENIIASKAEEQATAETPAPAKPVPPPSPIQSSEPKRRLNLPLLSGSRTQLSDAAPSAPKNVSTSGETSSSGNVENQLIAKKSTESIQSQIGNGATMSPDLSAPLPPFPLAAAATPVLPSSSSWWSYIGLASSTPLPASPALKPVSDRSDDVPSIEPRIGSVESQPVSIPISHNVEDNDRTPALLDNTPITTSDAPPAPTLDNSGARSSWFSSWVGWSASASGESPAAETHAEPNSTPELKESQAPVDTVPPASSPIVTPAVIITTSESNPIINSATRSSWVSFFSSRNLATVKTITGGNEMEVMDIEDDMPAAAPMNHGPTPTEANAKVPVSPTPQKAKPVPASVPNPTSPPPAPPLTNSNQVKKKASDTRRSTAAPKKDGPPRLPNLVLPAWEDTFFSAPRDRSPPPVSTLQKTLNAVTRLLAAPPVHPDILQYRQERQKRYGVESSHAVQEDNRRILRTVGNDLPRAWNVIADGHTSMLSGVKRVAIIGVHGWFPGVIMRTVLGEPTGTSKKFADMMEGAVKQYAEKHSLVLDKITKIPLEGEGSIETRVAKLFRNWQENPEWMEDLHQADAIFIATHSQGCVASTQLLDRLIADGHIFTGSNNDEVNRAAELYNFKPRSSPQRLCLLGMCGVHHGPLHWLSNSTVVNPYITYFESPAARELFEFQDSESAVSTAYTSALRRVLDHGTKIVYVASLNDQVVPLYSAAFTGANHPAILRALYMDGDAYSSSDFLSNLIVLLLQIRNAGLDDGSLLTHLSEATAGSLSGVGHSSAYEEQATYTLAVRYMFEASGPLEKTDLRIEPFQARAARNDYTIPWSLRGMIEDRRISALFSGELAELRGTFDQWQPKTTILKDVRRKLEPIRQTPKRSMVGDESRSKL